MISVCWEVKVRGHVVAHAIAIVRDTRWIVRYLGQYLEDAHQEVDAHRVIREIISILEFLVDHALVLDTHRDSRLFLGQQNRVNHRVSVRYRFRGPRRTARLKNLAAVETAEVPEHEVVL
ncbi:uncharacterized protein LOC128891293 [Hylaeus anthracinus]|uniref:uncharacterized protein LOC128891293 n=1 Tax=Hylaeus anthracinus TaxID=313031 RepID=UPI0023B9B775|nr:uncharacterized protein LOC128891293 [Hylaeus anthracinus]